MRAARWLLITALAASAVPGAPLAPGEAVAQSGPEISLRADTDDVEMGEPVTVTLLAMSDSNTPQPGEPQLKAPRGWVVTGPMVSTQTQMSIINGRVSQRSGFRATWSVVPTTTGSTEIGPVSFSLSGRRVAAGSVKINVRQPSPGGPKPTRPRNRPDPFGGIFGPMFGFDDDDFPPRAPAREVPPPTGQLSMDAPLEPQAFVHAVIDKPQAVVGEQVTLSIYLYSVPRSFQVVDPHESSSPDFFQRVLSTGDHDAHAVNVGGSRWMAQMIRKIALFPLKSGDLTVGPMTLTMLGQGFRGSGLRGGLVRASKPLVVRVTEPPPGPRPTGYVLGDVGSFTLQAQVEPRKVEAGGSISVTALVRGNGNPPSSLRLPERKGVSWLEPEVREAIDAGESTVSGTRSFTYIVKLADPGRVDLGELSFSFWNPKLREYQTARARLGHVDVLPSTATPAASGSAPAPAASNAPADPFAVIGTARKAPGAYAPPSAMWADAPWFWAALAAGPLSVLGLQGASGAWAGLRLRRKQRDESATTRARKALGEAREAQAKGDRKAAAGAVERALHIAVEASSGVKIRALLSHEVKPALEASGVSPGRAAAVVDLLAACEQERFLPGDQPSGVDLTGRLDALLKELS